MSTQLMPSASSGNRQYPETGQPKNNFRVEPPRRHNFEPAPAEAAGENFEFDSFLKQIAERAQRCGEADGSVIALRRQGRFVCVARCGDLGPNIGAQLEVRRGISGECLRTGTALLCKDSEEDPRVDADTCRLLGLRSIAVVPILSKSEVLGLVEVFSVKPSSFDHQHMEVLSQLAALVAESEKRFEQDGTGTTEQAWTLPSRLREQASNMFGARGLAEHPGRQIAVFWAHPYQVAVVTGFLLLDMLTIYAWYHR
jgi:L-methionine (R)-S-oxide reductase